MKTLTALSIASIIGFTASLAHARDLGPDEALRLRDAGTIVSFEKLNATALDKHRVRRSLKPSWKKSTASTATRSKCAIRRASIGIWN